MTSHSAVVMTTIMLAGCAVDERGARPDETMMPRVLMDEGPADKLFERKAHRREWVELASDHHFHEYGEAIFYFETGFRAFVVFDDDGYPLMYQSY